MKDIKLNHKAIILSSILNFLIAFIWYGPLFGDVWAKGAELIDPQIPPLWANILALFAAILPGYGIALLLKWTNQAGVRSGLKFGLFVTFAFMLQVLIGPWLFADRFLLFAVNIPYFTLTALLSGAIIGAWQKPSIQINE